jgi:hypothetical protein
MFSSSDAFIFTGFLCRCEGPIVVDQRRRRKEKKKSEKIIFRKHTSELVIARSLSLSLSGLRLAGCFEKIGFFGTFFGLTFDSTRSLDNKMLGPLSLALLLSLPLLAAASDESECNDCLRDSSKVWCADDCTSSASFSALGVRRCGNSCFINERLIPSCSFESSIRRTIACDSMVDDVVQAAASTIALCIGLSVGIPVCICITCVVVAVVVSTQQKGGQKGSVIQQQQQQQQQVQFMQPQQQFVMQQPGMVVQQPGMVMHQQPGMVMHQQPGMVMHHQPGMVQQPTMVVVS